MTEPRDRAAANMARVLRISRSKIDSAMKHATNAEWWDALPVLAELRKQLDGVVVTLKLPPDNSVRKRKASGKKK